MFWVSRVAAESEEVKDSIEDKVSSQPDGMEKEFLESIFPSIQLLLSQYSGMSGVTMAGELGSKRATVNITIYANELGD